MRRLKTALHDKLRSAGDAHAEQLQPGWAGTWMKRLAPTSRGGRFTPRKKVHSWQDSMQMRTAVAITVTLEHPCMA